MIIEKKPYGKSVKVWNKWGSVDNSDGYSEDWTYTFRNVRPLNEWHERLHPSIYELEA